MEEDASVLWLSRNSEYVCDGIIIPPENRPDRPVVIIDTSITHPYERESSKLDRLNTLIEQFSDDTKFQGWKVFVVLCYHKDVKSTYADSKR